MSDKKGPERILRVGIVHQGRIVEERLLRRPGDVTVGLSPKCTFMLPIQKPPELYRLFLWKDGGYLLRFTAGMVGKVSVGDEVLDLSEVREKGLARREGDYFLLPLGINAAGKVLFGEVRVLFQMVAPPPKPRKIPVPPAARGGPLAALDGPYAWSVLVSFLIHVVLAAGSQWWWVSSGQMEKAAQRESFVYRVLTAELTKKEKVEPQEQAGQGEGEGDGGGGGEDEGKGAKDEKPAPRFTKAASGGELSEEERYRRQVARVREGTILKYLDGPGGGIRGIVGAEAATEGVAGGFGSGRGATVIAGDSFGYRGGRGGGGSGGGSGGGGGNTYQRLSDEDIGGGGPKRPVQVASGQRAQEEAVRIRVGDQMGESSGPGSLSVSAIDSVFRRRRGAIQSCYERALRVNTGIEGKVSVRFTIGTAGNVTDVQILENSTGDSGVGACIADKIRSWSFPPPEGGIFIVTRHFLLMKSG